jgi:deoxyribonuclease-4
MTTLRFGTAGSPLSTTGKGRSAGVARSIELGLDCQELEFVHGVNIPAEDAAAIKTLASKHDFALTAHGPYYINLNAQEAEKVRASIGRIIETARALEKSGGTSATFHPGFYLGQAPEKVHENIKARLKTITKTLADEGNNVRISPETTGKQTQFGSLAELLRLTQEVENLGICIDFSHLYTRTVGKENGKESFDRTLALVEEKMGKEGLQRMHIHASGIEYGPKGEKNHTPLEQSNFAWKEMLASLKGHRVGGTLICESPVMEQDALLLKKAYRG